MYTHNDNSIKCVGGGAWSKTNVIQKWENNFFCLNDVTIVIYCSRTKHKNVQVKGVPQIDGCRTRIWQDRFSQSYQYHTVYRASKFWYSDLYSGAKQSIPKKTVY